MQDATTEIAWVEWDGPEPQSQDSASETFTAERNREFVSMMKEELDVIRVAVDKATADLNHAQHVVSDIPKLKIRIEALTRRKKELHRQIRHAAGHTIVWKTK